MSSSIVDIRHLDTNALSDDAVLREFYQLTRRSALYGREQAPFWDFRDFLGSVRSPDRGSHDQLYAAYDGDRMIGTAVLVLSLLDNTEKAWFQLDVDVPERRRGIGRALVARLEELARAAGRTVIMADTMLPFDDRETHGYRRFAEVCGYEVANFEVVRHLRLPVPDERLREWRAAAAPHHQGYSIETFVDHVPADLLESLCVLHGQLVVDAPTGAVDFEEEVITPGRFAEMLERNRAMGRAWFETVALTADRQVVAQSTLSVPREGSTRAFQWGTLVHRDHRGCRLGLAVKAANLAAIQAFRDDLSVVTTQNGETNAHMVSINDKIGFRPVEVATRFVKQL